MCVVAQAGDKAIQTPKDNSLLGAWFRKRLGLKDGDPISLKDLIDYGRTDVDFYKINDELYFLDFTKPTEI